MGVFGSLSLKELSMLKGLLGDSKAYCVMCQGSTVGKAGSVGCSCELDGFLWDGRRVWRFNRSGIRHGATGFPLPQLLLRVFPRQVTQGKANIGVSIHHRPWGAEARPLHQALIKGEIPLPGCQCGEQASTLRCRRGQDENDAQRLQNPLAKEYTLRDPTTI